MLIDAEASTWRFGAFACEALRLAAGLQKLGIGPGTQVTWQLPTCATTVLLSVALSRLGAVQNPIIHLYGRKEVGAILARNGSSFYFIPPPAADTPHYLELATTATAGLAQPPQVIVFDDTLAQDDLSGLAPPPSEGDSVRWVYYTSGTTAEPKGALHSDATLMAAGQAYAQSLAVSATDVSTLAFPYAHVGGPMNLVMLLAAGMSAVLVRKFQPESATRLFAQHGVTLSTGSTAHYLAFLGAQREQPGTALIPSLRLLSGGGAPKPPELYFDAQRELGCQIAHSYGMTEVPLITSASPAHTDEQLAHSDGAPIEGMQIRLVLADGTLAAAGESGELWVKGPTVCKGYTDPALNAQAFDSDGFFRTGDLGLQRPDGHITLTGRLKDVIIRKGENISAREIEDLLYAHPKVAGAAVIGLPDRERGERVCAVIELRDPEEPLSHAEMVAFFEAAGMMRQKIPEQLETVARLPRNETFNKVLKFKLREQWAQQS